MLRPKKLGHLVLKVSDLNLSERFYTKIIGLRITQRISNTMVFMSASDNASHELALMSTDQIRSSPEKNSVGLYHFAWAMDSLEDLQQIYQKIKNNDIEVVGIGDHGISIGVYILDPDGNQVEIFYELPKNKWPNTDIFKGNFPGSLDPNLK
jgi:catechol 2,3-dioxygenase